jgi:hypothetical protein
MRLVSHLSWITPNEQHSDVSAMENSDDKSIRPSRISRIADDVFFVIRAISDTIKETINDTIKDTVDAFHHARNIVSKAGNKAGNIIMKEFIINSIACHGYYYELLNRNSDKIRSTKTESKTNKNMKTTYFYSYHNLHKLSDDDKKTLENKLDTSNPHAWTITSPIDISGKLFDPNEVVRPQVLWVNLPGNENDGGFSCYHLEYRADECYEIPHLKIRRQPKSDENQSVNPDTHYKTALAWKNAAYSRLKVSQ